MLSQKAKQQKDDFCRIIVTRQENLADKETYASCKGLREAIKLREKYLIKCNEDKQTIHAQEDLPFDAPIIDRANYVFQIRDGLYCVYSTTSLDLSNSMFPAPADYATFLRDRKSLLEICAEAPVKSYCHRRLSYLEKKFELHMILNGMHEERSTKNDMSDFYNIVKVDNHIHLAAAMSANHLLNFVKRKYESSPTDIVGRDPDGEKTLKQVMDAVLETTPFTIDFLNVKADINTFHRFDNFNTKYNPFGVSSLRTVFMKTNNYNNGAYFAELTKELFAKNEQAKFVATEYRLSIYGGATTEWDELAKWVIKHNVHSASNRWIIQFPRIYDIHRKQNKVANFQQLIQNIFQPLFEVTVNPAMHPELYQFLLHVCAFDSVDDESKFEEDPIFVLPHQWTTADNPPYDYYLYFMQANLHILNQLRETRGLNTFAFRPHCGEVGDANHLAVGFMLANSVNHGIRVADSPSLQYLYYLQQVGLSVSPLSNNNLFLPYNSNPFQKFFKRGLNVTLSTDDPLQFHFTEEPLIEEYGIAAQIWKLSTVDLSEVARNSVLQSGFTHETKVKWLGACYKLNGPEGNDIDKSNIPDIRVLYRTECHKLELEFVDRCAEIATQQQSPPPPHAQLTPGSSSIDLQPGVVAATNIAAAGGDAWSALAAAMSSHKKKVVADDHRVDTKY